MILMAWSYARNGAGEPMLDDDHQITYASSFGSFKDALGVDCFGLFRPAKNIIFYAWTQWLPDNYQAWRLTSIAAFLGLIPLVYQFFGLFLGEKKWIQLIATLMWASAPATTAVVNWISTANIIASTYGLILFFLLHERSQKDLNSTAAIQGQAIIWKLGALTALTIACFSYEAALVAPGLLVIKEYVFARDRLLEKHNQIFLLLNVMVIGVYLIARSSSQGITDFQQVPTIPSDSDLWVSLSSGWMYLVHAIRWFWPYGTQGILIVFDPEAHKGLVIFSIIVVTLIGILLLRYRLRYPFLLFGLGWYGIALLPMANVVPLRNGPICDYYLFTPSLGLALLTGWCLQKILTIAPKSIVYGVAAIWIIAFVWTSTLWNIHWQSRQSLAQQTLRWQPDNYAVQGILAKYATDAGEYETAETLLVDAIKTAPWYDDLRYHRVMLLMQTQHFQEAIDELHGLIESHGETAKSLVFLAYVRDIHLGQTQEAERLLVSAMEKGWDMKYSRTGAMNLAAIYIRTNRIHFAEEVYNILLERYPGDQEIQELKDSLKGIQQGL